MPPLFCWLPSVCIALCLQPRPTHNFEKSSWLVSHEFQPTRTPRVATTALSLTAFTASPQQSQQLCRQKMLRTMRAAVAQAFVLVLCVLLPGGCFSAALLRVPASCMWPCLHARA